MRHALVTLICWLLFVTVANAQPTIQVLGVGNVAFDIQTTTLAEAQAQTYRAYVDTRPAIQLTVTCAGIVAPFTCTFSLSVLALTGTHTLALTAVTIAADGEQESAKVVAPFFLRKAAPPWIPLVASFKVQPKR